MNLHTLSNGMAKTELRSGAVIVSSEETTGAPKPRTPLPRPLSHYAQEGGAPLQYHHFTANYGYRAMHHPQCSCAIWDCGHGMMESVPYLEVPVWAQQGKGQPVPLPVDGWKQRRALVDYRELFAEISIRLQKKTRILSSLGTFWRMVHHAQFDEYRAGNHAIAHRHRC